MRLSVCANGKKAANEAALKSSVEGRIYWLLQLIISFRHVFIYISIILISSWIWLYCDMAQLLSFPVLNCCITVKWCRFSEVTGHSSSSTICPLAMMLTLFCYGAPGGLVGRAGAPYAEAVSSLHWPQVRFHLWPFAACHSPSLSPVSCLLFSYPIKEIKAEKA